MRLQPTFDHDLARRMYAAGGWTHKTLAAHFGVSTSRITQIVNPRVGAKARARGKQWQHDHYNQPCANCGKPGVWKKGNSPTTGLCHACAALLRRTAKHGTESRYNRGCKCDACRKAAAVARQRRRHANPHASSAYNRAYARKRRAAA